MAKGQRSHIQEFTAKTFTITSTGRSGKDFWVTQDPTTPLQSQAYCPTSADLARYLKELFSPTVQTAEGTLD